MGINLPSGNRRPSRAPTTLSPSTARSINVADGYHLWSDRFDRQLEDVFAIQDEIAASIVERLRVKFGIGEAAPKANRTENQEGNDLYLRGRHYMQTEQGWRKAIECFGQALAVDPDYAAVHAGIAAVYSTMSAFGTLSAEQVAPKAKAAARVALENDESLAEAHQALADVRILNWGLGGCGAHIPTGHRAQSRSCRRSQTLRYLAP